jgi:hypothetical protein
MTAEEVKELCVIASQTYYNFRFLGEFSGGQKKSPESVKKVTFRLWNQISYMSYC